jgi:hypothetical protein
MGIPKILGGLPVPRRPTPRLQGPRLWLSLLAVHPWARRRRAVPMLPWRMWSGARIGRATPNHHGLGGGGCFWRPGRPPFCISKRMERASASLSRPCGRIA